MIWNKRCPGGNKSGVFLNHAMLIKNGAANINLIPVANTGGIVSAAIRMASHVVPQVSATSRNNTDIVTLRIRCFPVKEINVSFSWEKNIVILSVFSYV